MLEILILGTWNITSNYVFTGNRQKQYLVASGFKSQTLTEDWIGLERDRGTVLSAGTISFQIYIDFTNVDNIQLNV